MQFFCGVKEGGRRRKGEKNEFCRLTFFPANRSLWKERMRETENSERGELSEKQEEGCIMGEWLKV